jgi:ankyrin repeat protein
MVELFLANGAGVNVRGKNHVTALHSAAGKGHKNVIELLLANSANLNMAESISGTTALYWAVKNGHKEVADLLRRYGAKE